MDQISDRVSAKAVTAKCATDSAPGNMNTYTRSQRVIESLKKKNYELNNDIMVLKRLVYMLNVELEFRESAPVGTAMQPACLDSKAKEYLTNSDIRSIEPLLRAFEETKKEKDELLSKYKKTFDEFSTRCKEIASENSTLRQELQEYKIKAESSLTEWKKLHEKFILTEEHNQLLTRQVKLLQNKFQGVETIYRDKVKQLDEEKKEINEKLESSRTELFLLKGKLSVLSEIKIKPNLDRHEQEESFSPSPSIIAELKKLSVELRLHQTKELQILKTRLKMAESLKCDLEIKLASVTSERDHLLGYNSAMKSESRQINAKLQAMQNELETAKKNEEDLRLQLMKSLTFIRELVSSRNIENPDKSSDNVLINLDSDNLD